MKFRKSKYDWFILYDLEKNEIVLMKWDCAWDGLSEWFHTNGPRAWWIKGNRYISELPVKYEVVDRFHESERF